MASRALGLIETIGLPTAIEAADAAAKSANITLLGYENARGGGRITVKMVGDVGAVQAAVSAGVAAAMRIGPVMSCLVIPRPNEQIEALVNQVDHGRVTVAPVAAPPLSAEAATPKPAAAKPAAARRPVPPKTTAPAIAAKPKASAAKPTRLASPTDKLKASAAKPAPIAHPAEPAAPPIPLDTSPAQPSAPDQPEEPAALPDEI